MYKSYFSKWFLIVFLFLNFNVFGVEKDEVEFQFTSKKLQEVVKYVRKEIYDSLRHYEEYYFIHKEKIKLYKEFLFEIDMGHIQPVFEYLMVYYPDDSNLNTIIKEGKIDVNKQLRYTHSYPIELAIEIKNKRLIELLLKNGAVTTPEQNESILKIYKNVNSHIGVCSCA